MSFWSTNRANQGNLGGEPGLFYYETIHDADDADDGDGHCRRNDGDDDLLAEG